MSKFDYSKSAATALRLITKFGQDMTIRRTEASGNVNPWDSAGVSSIDYAATGIVSDYTEGLIDGEAVKYGDKRVKIAAKGLSITPLTTDTLIVGGVSYTIIRVNPISPAGTLLVYELQARV